MLRSIFRQSNYEYSNSIIQIKIAISNEAINLAQTLLKTTDTQKRHNLSEQLLDELSDLAGIDIVEFILIDDNQIHKKRDGKIVMKRYGLYQPKNKTILIHNRTAIRGQILAPKSYIDTLLHEWLHHYDFKKLKLNPIHSRGFYMRLNDLKNKLKIPKEIKNAAF
mgnify:CR=1 FL=1